MLITPKAVVGGSIYIHPSWGKAIRNRLKITKIAIPTDDHKPPLIFGKNSTPKQNQKNALIGRYLRSKKSNANIIAKKISNPYFVCLNLHSKGANSITTMRSRKNQS